MDPNAAVIEIQQMTWELSRLPEGSERKALQLDLVDRRRDLREWHRKGGFEPKIGWKEALSL